jgi:hypothetical protein
MTLIATIRDIAARRALRRKIHAEMASITEEELRDLNLSYAKITELSRQQAYAN